MEKTKNKIMAYLCEGVRFILKRTPSTMKSSVLKDTDLSALLYSNFPLMNFVIMVFKIKAAIAKPIIMIKVEL